MSKKINTLGFQQLEKSSCGPCTLKIIQEILLDKFNISTNIPDEYSLAREAGITHHVGMSLKSLEKMAKKYLQPHGIDIQSHNDPDILDAFDEEGHIIIPLHLTLRKNSPHNSITTRGYGYHYGVVESVNENHLILLNPFGFVEEFTRQERIQHRGLKKQPISFLSKLVRFLGIAKPYSSLVLSLKK